MNGRRAPGPAAASQCDRILSWAFAGHVIHQDDWWPGPGADGTGGIRAVRSRISQLEGEGYGFHHTTRPDRTMEYRLAYVPKRRAPSLAEPQPGDELAREALESVRARDADVGEQLPLDLEAPDPPAPSSPDTRPSFFGWDEAA